ncbi:MAG: hypothetical protein HY707_10685 [Ignavibacteriae bacterium]|nr:hypothetical protein [Ignavibacteriota bacterium]
MTNQLDNEIRTYELHRSELLGNSKGKFALVKDDKIVGIFEDKLDAIRQGYERFGNVPFLVKQILEVETPQNFTSNLLAI